jgi:hypothetical protein
MGGLFCVVILAWYSNVDLPVCVSSVLTGLLEKSERIKEYVQRQVLSVCAFEPSVSLLFLSGTSFLHDCLAHFIFS